MPTWMDALPGLPFWLAVLGLCLGSFLNVVIHRLPRGLSLWRPGSRCPRCGTSIAPHDNIPVVSFLLLRGRCRHCHASIAVRYPLVELLGAGCVLAASFASPTAAAAAARSAFLLAMLAIAVIDLDVRIIPDEISLPGILTGLLLCPLIGVSRGEALIGTLAGVVGLLLIASLYRRVRKMAGLGLGDVKLAGMVGAWLGWQGLVMTLFFGSLVGSATGIALMARGRATGRTALPYGSFLAPAAMLVVVLGPRIWSWYLGLGR